MVFASIGLIFLWFALPEAYSFINELTLAPINSMPVNWKTIEEPKWRIRIKVPSDAVEQDQGDLWVHKNDSIKVIVDFGKDGLDSFVSEIVRVKTGFLKKNYSQRILMQNGLKTMICSYEKAPDLRSDQNSKVVELVHLESRDLMIGAKPTFRVEFKSETEKQIALQILQSVTFFEP